MKQEQMQQNWIESGSKMPAKRDMPKACEHCQGASLKRRVATYPIVLKQPPKLSGKRIDVHRVALHECFDCGYLMPTAPGKAKIERCVASVLEMFLGPS